MSFIVAKAPDESIKLMYPIKADGEKLFTNEIHILSKFKNKFDDPEENGIVRLIDSGEATWKHFDDAEVLPGNCSVFVYTYGRPLFPILKRLVIDNDRAKLFWYFGQMVGAKTKVLLTFK